MKKLLLFASLLVSGLAQLSAQCTIMPSCSTGTVGYCTTPAVASNLPNGTEQSPYSTTIQFSLGTSAFGGAITITDATINSVNGMPAGFTYSTNPVSGMLPAGTDACLILGGTPTLGSAGSYSIDVIFDVNTSFGPTSQTLSWYLTIDPAGTTSVKSITSSSYFVISPNPANAELFVSSASHFGKVNIIDALGKTVLSHDANYATQTSINISSLSKGVYFLQVNNGTNVTTKKFIKE